MPPLSHRFLSPALYVLWPEFEAKVLWPEFPNSFSHNCRRHILNPQTLSINIRQITCAYVRIITCITVWSDQRKQGYKSDVSLKEGIKLAVSSENICVIKTFNSCHSLYKHYMAITTFDCGFEFGNINKINCNISTFF